MKLAEEFLLKKNFTDIAQLAVWRSEAIREIEDTVAQVQREPAPDPFAENWTALATENLSEGRE